MITDSLLIILNLMENFVSFVQPIIFLSLTAVFFNDIILPKKLKKKKKI